MTTRPAPGATGDGEDALRESASRNREPRDGGYTALVSAAE